MQTKHSPGPWGIAQTFVCHTRIADATGENVAATTCHFDNPEEFQARDAANARLIAAAPNLLIIAQHAREFAITVLGESENENCRKWATDMLTDADAAIDQAAQEATR